MDDPDDRMTTKALVRLSHVALQEAIDRHFRIREEAVQRFSIGHCLHLLREAVVGRGSRQLDDTSQALAQPGVS